MPYQSMRKKAIAAAQRTLRAASALFVVGHVLSDVSHVDVEDPHFACYYRAKLRLNRIVESRYSVERKHRKSPLESIFDDDLRESADGTHWMNDIEFKQKYRCSRDALDRITEEIKTHDVFKKGKRGRRQMSVKHQLMTLLHFFGCEAESNSTQRNQFKIGKGTSQKHRERCVIALNSLRDKYITWPDENERKQIARRIEKKFFLPNAVSLMDGTLLPLGIAPSCDDAADYHGRKFRYSLTVNVINDDHRRIRAYLAGFPGSAHDNRVWKHMKQHEKASQLFSEWEYLLCDTAYEPDSFCVPAYKCQSGYVQPRDEEEFNTCLARVRVITEHTMGLWKGRFPWLRNIRMNITNDPESLNNILRNIDATVVLHNMLIEFGDDDDEDCPWRVDGDALSDIDDPVNRIPERAVLDAPIPVGSVPGTRREQLKNLVRDYWAWDTGSVEFNYDEGSWSSFAEDSG